MKGAAPLLYLPLSVEGRCHLRDQLQPFAPASIRTIRPAPSTGLRRRCSRCTGFVGVKRPTDGDHTVPGAVWLEVVGVCDGIGLHEGTEVGHGHSCAIRIHAKDGVVGPGQPVRAADANLQPVEGTVDELDVNYTAY